jgi:hypothetical protein
MVGVGVDDPLNRNHTRASHCLVRPIAILLVCACGAAEPVSSPTVEQSISVACVPTDYFHPPADCARPTFCDDGNQCPPHIGIRCAGTGQCVGDASRCAELDAGTAVTCR